MTYNIVDYADEEPVRQRIVNKQVWDQETQKFTPKTFIRMYCTTRQREDAERWLRKHYGPPTYQGMWWSMHTSNEVWMNDALYTFWQLKYGNKS